jgi:hypothetical protein
MSPFVQWLRRLRLVPSKKNGWHERSSHWVDQPIPARLKVQINHQQVGRDSSWFSLHVYDKEKRLLNCFHEIQVFLQTISADRMAFRAEIKIVYHVNPRRNRQRYKACAAPLSCIGRLCYVQFWINTARDSFALTILVARTKLVVICWLNGPPQAFQTSSLG